MNGPIRAREDMDLSQEGLDRIPTEAEKVAWITGRQLSAIRSYRYRVHPDRGLEAVVSVLEEATSVKRMFTVLPTVHLGTMYDQDGEVKP